MRSKLTEIENFDDRQSWVSEPYIESVHPLRFILRLEYTEAWGDNVAALYGRYHVSILAVGPEWVPAEQQQRAAESVASMSQEEWSALDDIYKCTILADYGISAQLWAQSGNNRRNLLRKARQELGGIYSMFRFYMDRPQNRIGATGWDFIRGEVSPVPHT